MRSTPMESDVHSNMLSKHRAFILSAFILAIIAPNILALACTPAIPKWVVNCTVDVSLLSGATRCLDADCLYLVSPDVELRSSTITSQTNEWQSITATSEGVEAYTFAPYRELNEMINLACVEDLDSILSDLLSPTWQVQSIPFHTGGLLIQPYSEVTYRDLTAANWQLHRCHYQAVLVRDGWMASQKALRDYCHPTAGLILILFCGGTDAAISPFGFIQSLITQHSPVAIGYLAFISLLVCLLLVAICHLIRRKQLARALLPNRWTVGIMLVLLILLACPIMATSVELIGYWALMYLPLSVIGGLVGARRPQPRSNGENV